MKNFFPVEYVEVALDLARNYEDFDNLAHYKCRDWVEARIPRSWSPSPGAKCGVGGGLVYISPCGQFILKHSKFFLPYGEEDPVYLTYGIPTFFTNDPIEAERQWVLQPVADISKEAVSFASAYFRAKYSDYLNTRWDERPEHSPDNFEDLHDGNVALWNGKPVLIDF